MFCDFDSYHLIIYVYMDVDYVFGIVLQMWDPEVVRQRMLGSRLIVD
jgi:hypothetical protein